MFWPLILFGKLLFFIILLFLWIWGIDVIYLYRWHSFILWSYIFILILLWNLILVQRSVIPYWFLLVKPPEAQMLLCWGYFVFISGVENKTLSQMCGRLYLPISLLRVGLLTLMYIASFMALAIFCPSLSIILKLSTVVVWPVVLWWSTMCDGAFKCSLCHSSDVLALIYASSHSALPHLNQYIMLLCLVIASLTFGNISKLFRVFPPLKCTWTPYLPQMVL